MRPSVLGAGAALLLAVGVASALLHRSKPSDAPKPIQDGPAPKAAPPALLPREADLALRDLEAEKARLAGEVRRLPSLEKAPAAAPVEPPKDRKRDLTAVMDMFGKMLDSPAVQEEMRAEMLAFVKEHYGEPIRGWGLEREAQASVEGILADRLIAEEKLDLMILDERVGEAEILRAQDEVFLKARVDLSRHLDAGRIGRLEEHEKGLPRRFAEKRVDQALSGLKLEPTQQERIRGIILEEEGGLPPEFRMMQEGARFGPKSAEEIRAARALELHPDPKAVQGRISASLKESNARIEARISPFLAPEQMTAYKRSQDARLRRMERSAALEESMLGMDFGDVLSGATAQKP